MRQMDEITERRATRPLPAPTGPRSPTGPVPLIASAGSIPPPADALQVLPYLPAVAPKASSPATGPVPITSSMASMLGIAEAPVAPVTPARRKRNYKRARRPLAILAIMLAVVMLLGLLFRNSAFVQRFTGSGYDSNLLPTHSIPIPELAGAEYAYTFESIDVAQGVPSHLLQTDHDDVDFAAGIAKLSINSEVAQIVDDKIGSPVVPGTPKELFVNKTSTFQRGAAATDPWVRTPLVPGSRADTILGGGDIRMYQDVFDPTLRAQTPVSVVDETRHDVAVTTYTYDFPVSDFYESAPRLFDWARSMEGNAADDAIVTVTISLDEQMLVRYVDVSMDYLAVIDHLENVNANGTYRYRSTFELISTAGATKTLAIPTNVVAPTTTKAPTFDTVPTGPASTPVTAAPVPVTP